MIHTSFTLPHVEDKACRMLWSAVLCAVIRDLCASSAQSRARQDAERWVGAWPDRDFRTVCHMAELEPDVVHDALSALIRLPVAERRKAAAARLGCKTLQIGNALTMRNTGPKGTDTYTEGQGEETRAAKTLTPALRRDRVADMFSRGIAPTDMPDLFAAEGTNVPISTIWNDIRHLRTSARIGYAGSSASSNRPITPTSPNHSAEGHVA